MFTSLNFNSQINKELKQRVNNKIARIEQKMKTIRSEKRKQLKLHLKMHNNNNSTDLEIFFPFIILNNKKQLTNVSKKQINLVKLIQNATNTTQLSGLKNTITNSRINSILENRIFRIRNPLT
jgi:hypothetical protein